MFRELNFPLADQCQRSESSCIRVVKAPFFKANLKAVSKRPLKAVKRLLYVVNMMNDCFKMHYTSVHLVVSNCHHDKTMNHDLKLKFACKL